MQTSGCAEPITQLRAHTSRSWDLISCMLHISSTSSNVPLREVIYRARNLATHRGDQGKMIHFFEVFLTGYILLLLDILCTVKYWLQLGRKKYRHKVTSVLETNHSKVEVLINSKFGLSYSNFLILTPTFSKVPIEKYDKTPFFPGKQHFYSFLKS